MRKNILLSILLIFSIGLFSQTATVNLGSEKQVIRGFGGINHAEWYSDLNAAERQLAFGNGSGQLGFTVLRTYVSENSNNWSGGLQTAQYAYDNGAYVFASPWNPPAGMHITVNGVKRINPATYSQYADHLNSYVTYMRNNGVELYAISTQNEPDYAHDWTEWSAQESVDFIKGYASRINCRLMTPESFQYRKDVYDPILNDPAALANVDIFGTHLYGTQYNDFPYPLFEQKGAGKELWMTEVYTDSKYDANIWSDSYINDSRHAIKVAEHIHYAMVDGNFQTYVFWPLRRYYALIHDGNADGNGNNPAAAGTATKRGYCMAQFSKWVRPGYVRVDATKSPSTNVFVSAYKKDADVVIVVVNKNTSTRTITLDIPGTQVSTWEQYTTSASKNIAKGNSINSGSSFQVTLDAASVTTFVGAGNAGIPSVEILSPSNGEVFVAPATVTIDASATDENGTIAHINYYVNDVLVQEEWVAPYAFDYVFEQAGDYTIRAVAYDNDNNTGETEVSITVNIPQGPFGGTATNVTDRIEFENFDAGGNGFAYYDADPGTNVDPAPNYRNDEDVDIENCTDTDGGYNIGWTTSGEWLEYTVNVPASGTYDLIIRAACNGDGRTVSLTYENGTDIASNIAITNTGGWQVWTDIVVQDVELTAGEQVLRLTIGATDYVNLNYMTFIPTATAPAVTITSPLNNYECNTAETITIEATATVDGSTISKVTFYNGTTMLYSDDNAPYSYNWNNLEEGTHQIIAQATSADNRNGYDTVSVTIVAAPPTISLKTGWNLIGCPIDGSTNIEDALSSIWPYVISVKNADKYWLRDNSIPGLNTLLKLNWGEGYVIKVTQNCDLNWQQ